MTSILTPAALRVAAAALARAGAGSALTAIVLLVLASTTRAGFPTGMTPVGVAPSLATGTSASVAVAAAESAQPTLAARGMSETPTAERDVVRLAGRSDQTPRLLQRRGARPFARAP